MEKDTRLKLVETAAPLFAKKGFAAVSVRELAQAAGANVAAVSYHFGGKEGLYQAVLEHQFAPIAGALALLAALPPGISGQQRLTLYAERIAGIHSQRPYLVRFMHSELTNPTVCFETVVKKYITQVYAFLHQAIADGVAAGEFRPDLDIGFATLSLAGTMNFYFIARPLFREIVPLPAPADEKYTAQAFHIFLHGIRRQDHE